MISLRSIFLETPSIEKMIVGAASVRATCATEPGRPGVASSSAARPGTAALVSLRLAPAARTLVRASHRAGGGAAP